MKKSLTLGMLLVLTFSFGQKLFIVKADDKFGLINDSGLEVISPKYNSIQEFDRDHVN